MVILIGVFCIAVYMDLRFYRIPNGCILIGVVSGCIMTLVSYSAAGLLAVCVAMAVIFAVFYPFYLMGGLGAGDVKLLMVTGCFIRGERIIQYLLVTFMIAAMLSVIKGMLFQACMKRLLYFGRYMRKAVLTGSLDTYRLDRTDKRCVIRLSVPAFASLIMMCIGVY